MSKYKALSNFLADHGGDSWKVSFDHLESLLGISLPRTAREKASWWENDDSSPKPHAKAWLDQGFRTSALDMAGGEVTFVRHRAVGERGRPRPRRRSASSRRRWGCSAGWGSWPCGCWASGSRYLTCGSPKLISYISM
jgi:hypothetical protein